MNPQRYNREVLGKGNRQFSCRGSRIVGTNCKIAGLTYYRNKPCNRTFLTGGTVIFKFNLESGKRIYHVDGQGTAAMPPGSEGKNYRVIIFKETNTAMCKPSRS